MLTSSASADEIPNHYFIERSHVCGNASSTFYLGKPSHCLLWRQPNLPATASLPSVPPHFPTVSSTVNSVAALSFMTAPGVNSLRSSMCVTRLAISRHNEVKVGNDTLKNVGGVRSRENSYRPVVFQVIGLSWVSGWKESTSSSEKRIWGKVTQWSELGYK